MGLGNYKNGSGIEAALFFAREGARVLVTDLKPAGELAPQLKRLLGFKNVSYVLGKHRVGDFGAADLVFQNPAVPGNSPYLEMARRKKIPIINDWSVFLEKFQGVLIGVTGTRGKSTTATLIYEIIKAGHKRVLLAGNIGVSPLKYLGRANKGTVVVAELSSWLLRGFGSAEASPRIAVLTNLYPDHLDKYEALEDYYRDKENIFRFQHPTDFLIANFDNREVRARVKRAVGRKIWFSKEEIKRGDGIYPLGKDIVFRRGKEIIRVAKLSDIRLAGRHNLENVLAATAAALVFGIQPKAVGQALRQFKGLADRLEFLGKAKGVEFYNDTTATSPEGTIAALESLARKKGKIILLGGGSDKKLDFKKYVEAVNGSAKALILFQGEASKKISRLLGAGSKLRPKEAGSMAEALELALGAVRRGDVILLSPGAASFGLFKNEFDRGNQFKKLVKKWAK